MRVHPRLFSPDEGARSLPLPGLRPGVVLIGAGEDAELRDLRLGQVVKLGEVAAVIVALLDGRRDAEELLRDAQVTLGEELNPYGLVELLQALDRRALLDTPRARMVVAQGLVRADIAALQRLGRRVKPLRAVARDATSVGETPNLAPGTSFTCHSCNKCCSSGHLLGPVTVEERDAILTGFTAREDAKRSEASNFLPLPTTDGRELYLLRTRNGFCTYLGEDGLCSIHKLLGVDRKPAVCRMFPYRVVRTPTGWDAGLSLSCPTVASGSGGDALPEAREKLTSLPIFASLIHEIPASLPLGEGQRATWGDYRAWESRALALVQDRRRDPAAAWVAAVADLASVVHRLAEGERGAETTTEFMVAAPDPATLQTPDPEGKQFVPEMGVGEAPIEPVAAADAFAREIALWAELLVGLEAADPDALRHLRSAATRVRGTIDHEADAAPVLAEMARLRARAIDAEVVQLDPDPLGEDTEELLSEDVQGTQRRFLTQALMDKRLFEYGNVLRGTAALTFLLAVLRLPEQPGDDLRANIEDVAYLVHHPQLTDVFDSRASVRGSADDVAFHAAILGVRLSAP